MREVGFDCFKIAPRINLKNIAAFFNLSWPASGRVEFIVLEDSQIETILKYGTHSKVAYIFEFGCITLVNFETDEINIFMEYIESITNKMQSGMILKYYERYEAEIDNSGFFKLYDESESCIRYNRNVEVILSVIMAKSTALFRVESEVDELMDKAEKYVDYLQKGWLHTHTRKFSAITARILRFEYDSIYSIEILDRIIGFDKKVKLREIYDEIAEYYELGDRFNILRNKVDNLRKITRAYTKLSYERHENRLYLFEVFLLILFPLSYLFRYLIKYKRLETMLPKLFTSILNFDILRK
ncbi:MAG TPA: RMD1 family protein [Clostridiales bacterium]|nr:RMD1 family protein [Clostridiales bacterium]